MRRGEVRRRRGEARGGWDSPCLGADNGATAVAAAAASQSITSNSGKTLAKRSSNPSPSAPPSALPSAPPSPSVPPSPLLLPSLPSMPSNPRRGGITLSAVEKRWRGSRGVRCGGPAGRPACPWSPRREASRTASSAACQGWQHDVTMPVVLLLHRPLTVRTRGPLTTAPQLGHLNACQRGCSDRQ